ncbi:DnaJ domain-containing protein [Dipodascopsis tothii]|uniref:DnaJ domain-containing protein n=1 Tax=Dipodascopsis tothii TaxID=44089 RepID=UPI0034D00191
MVEVLCKLPETKSELTFECVNVLTPLVRRSLEPIGPAFLAHARRSVRGRSWSEDERAMAETSVKTVEDDDVSDDDEPEFEDDLLRDPKDWKSQDHYRVLGLTKYRINATDDQIRRAHRKKVLKHHPDKKAASGGLNEDGFFKCIQKAMEILSDPVKRRQFDSVDYAADVAPPSRKTTGNFYELWGPVFAAEGRFSRVQPVPKLGDETTAKKDMDAFYSFFYNFDSWRSFEYLDEDVPDDSSNRDNKRHIERKNKAARQKHKTDDNARLRKLVDDCLGADPRVKMFKDAEKKAKEQRKWEREADSRKAAEEAKAAAEAAEKARAEQEEREKAEKVGAKKAKENAKNAKKKNRRVVKAAAKDANYFVDGTASASAIDGALSDVDVLFEKVSDEELADLTKELTGLTDAAAIKAVFVARVEALSGAGKLSASSLKILKA